MELTEPEPEDGLLISNYISETGWPIPQEDEK